MSEQSTNYQYLLVICPTTLTYPAGIDEEDQLLKIFQLVGSPTEDTWPGITRLPRYSNISGFPPKPIANVVPALNTAVSIHGFLTLTIRPINWFDSETSLEPQHLFGFTCD